MYIEDVLKSCDTLYPNPYTDDEKYRWCDEVSFMLAVKLNICYEKTELLEENGKFVLPEGINTSLLENLIYGNAEVKKADFHKLGIKCRDVNGRCEIEFTKDTGFKRIYAVYIVPCEKIRNIVIDGEITFNESSFSLNENIFRLGDELEISVNDEIYKNIFVTGCEEQDGKTVVAVKANTLPVGQCNCRIYRKVTEMTVCPPPYDSMYVDYVLGKICYYQNDFAACNNHMSVFNSKLADYGGWVKSHPITGYVNTKLQNWW